MLTSYVNKIQINVVCLSKRNIYLWFILGRCKLFKLIFILYINNIRSIFSRLLKWLKLYSVKLQ